MGYMASAGSALLSNPTALLAAAGVAWGIFETMQGNAQGQPVAGGAGLNTAGGGLNPPATTADSAASMPPLPVAGAVAAPMTDATRMVRLALSAAQADGALSAEERATVVARAENTRNPKLATGDVEVHAQQLLTLNDARTPPFQLDASANAPCTSIIARWVPEPRTRSSPRSKYPRTKRAG